MIIQSEDLDAAWFLIIIISIPLVFLILVVPSAEQWSRGRGALRFVSEKARTRLISRRRYPQISQQGENTCKLDRGRLMVLTSGNDGGISRVDDGEMMGWLPPNHLPLLLRSLMMMVIWWDRQAWGSPQPFLLFPRWVGSTISILCILCSVLVSVFRETDNVVVSSGTMTGCGNISPLYFLHS